MLGKINLLNGKIAKTMFETKNLRQNGQQNKLVIEIKLELIE